MKHGSASECGNSGRSDVSARASTASDSIDARYDTALRDGQEAEHDRQLSCALAVLGRGTQK